MKLVTTVDQVKSNILSFHKALGPDSDHKITETLARYRAWYAIPDGKGSWALGPSKVIGYAEMSPSKYVKADVYQMSGVTTEKVLNKWFNVLDEEDDLFDEISEKLHDMLSNHGKRPSSAFRISILKDETASNDEIEETAVAFKTIYDALPPAVRVAFKRMLD